MDIINLRNNVWGKTADGKTLYASLVFISTLVERPASSRADGMEQEKTKKNLNETKDMTKHLPGEQLAAVKIEGKRKEMRSWITSKVCQ